VGTVAVQYPKEMFGSYVGEFYNLEKEPPGEKNF
jgi:hypothetical protein